jgi:hypothetical protein
MALATRFAAVASKSRIALLPDAVRSRHVRAGEHILNDAANLVGRFGSHGEFLRCDAPERDQFPGLLQN